MRRKSLVLFGAALLAGCGTISSDSASKEGGPASARKAASQPASGGTLARAIEAVRPAPLVVPEGTALALVLQTTVSSGTSDSGDLVVAKLASEVRVDDRVALPAGAELRGRVTSAVPSGRVKGRARLVVDFDTVIVKGKQYPLEARPIDVTAKSAKGRDAKVVGGAAAGGAIIGAIADGGKGAGIGAVAGAAAGTGVVLATKGYEVELAAGSRWSIATTGALTLS